MDPDPVGSGFIWVRGSGSRGIKSLIKSREKQSLSNKNLFFSQEIICFKSEPSGSGLDPDPDTINPDPHHW